jgi:hypothetical protein
VPADKDIISFKYCGLMPSKPSEEPAGKELIASRTFCSLTIKEKSPVLKASGKKVHEMVKHVFEVKLLIGGV